MAERKVSREGVITVRFPPPTPDDLGEDLRSTIDELLGGAGECAAAAGLDDRDPWGFDIRVDDPTAAAGWAGTVAALLLRSHAPQATVVRVRRRYGPVVVPLPAGAAESPDLSALSIPGEDRLGARVCAEVTGLWKNYSALADAVRAAVAGAGTVADATGWANGDAWFEVIVPDIHRAPGCVRALLDILRAHKASDTTALSVFTETPAAEVLVHPDPAT